VSYCSQHGEVLQLDRALQVLNLHLAENSYLDGFVPSRADLAVYESLSRDGASVRGTYPHVQRWFRHIGSLGEDTSRFRTSGCTVSVQFVECRLFLCITVSSARF
jgi:hypothetical protein